MLNHPYLSTAAVVSAIFAGGTLVYLCLKPKSEAKSVKPLVSNLSAALGFAVASDKIFGDRDKKEIRRSIKQKRTGKSLLRNPY